MATRFVLVLVLSIIYVSASHGFLTSKVKKTLESEEYSVVRQVAWRLGANNRRGTVSAEIEVSDHDDFRVSWHIIRTEQEQDGTTKSYALPLESTQSQDVFVQRFWSAGKAFMSSEIIFHPVPHQPQLNLGLEVGSRDYGSTLYHILQLPLSTGPFAGRQVRQLELPEVLSYPGAVVHHQAGQTVQLIYKLRAKYSLSVDVNRAVRAQVTTKILEAVSMFDDGQLNENIDINHEASDGDWLPITVTLTLQSLPADEKRMYELIFSGTENADTFISVATLVLPAGQNSLFVGAGIHMELQACDHFAKVSDTLENVRFEFAAGAPFCVKCLVTNAADNEITHNHYPIGSGPSHSVYWHSKTPDIQAGVFVVYNQSFQSYSYGGSYTCSAHGYDGSYMERNFEIVFV